MSYTTTSTGTALAPPQLPDQGKAVAWRLLRGQARRRRWQWGGLDRAACMARGYWMEEV